MQPGLPLWIIATQWAARGVLILLFVLSIWSLATMLRCFRILTEAGTSTGFRTDLAKLEGWIAQGRQSELLSWAEAAPTMHAGVIRTALSVGGEDPARIDRAVRSYLALRRSTLEEGMTVLATLGSNAPFIGLFGTVLGIIQAFGALGAHQTASSEIMAGISEALVATAVGLFVAIPAVVAFNVLSRRLRVIVVQAESLRDLYLSRLGLRA